ncbi:hypothetical protein C1N64_05645 [Pantoea sp. SGAir0215]
MKKNIIKTLLFIGLFILIASVTFEITFRFGDADSFISLLGKLSFLGFQQSFNSLFVFLLIISLMISSLLYYLLTLTTKRKNRR